MAAECLPSSQAKQSLETLSMSPNYGWIISEEDLSPLGESILLDESIPVIGYIPRSVYQAAGIQDSVFQFRQQCLQDSLPQNSQIVDDTPSLIQWVRQHHFRTLYILEPKQGLWNTVLTTLELELLKTNCQLERVNHAFDLRYLASERGILQIQEANTKIPFGASNSKLIRFKR